MAEECAILSGTKIKLNSPKLLKIMQMWSLSRLMFDWPDQLNPLAHTPPESQPPWSDQDNHIDEANYST